MSRRHRFTIILFAILILSSYFSFYLIKEGSLRFESVSAIDGQLDLSSWNPNYSRLKLEGEWRYYDANFYDNLDADTSYTLVPIPENIKTTTSMNFFRYGTYVLTLNGLPANQAFGIYSGSQVTAYNLYANGKIVFHNGRVASDAKDHVSEWKPLSGTVYSNEHGQIQLAMEISNYDYPDGLFWGAIQFGDTDQIFNDYYNKRMIDTLFLMVFFSIAIVLNLLYQFSKQDKSMLHFSLLVSMMAVRLAVTSSRPIMFLLDGIPWNVLVRLEYFTGYMLLPCMILFTLSLMNSKRILLYERLTFLSGILLATLVAFSKHSTYTSIRVPLLALTGLSIFALMVLILVHYRKEPLNRYVFILIFINFIPALYNELFGSLISYVPVALLNCVLGVTALMINSFLVKLRETELMAMNALIDPLTGLYNRHYFDELSNEHFRPLKDKESYILFIDLDGFKKINDQYGHEEGDQVLQIVSQRLRHCIRNNDTIIRYGGDEFVILLQSSSSEDIKKTADRIVETLSNPIVDDKKNFTISASVGITKFNPSKDLSLHDYIRNSDKIMYDVKENGGNSYSIGHL
ncbi:MAG: diguanylate cyclase [Vallitaleaceae bacterium]|nr:diguanylate cyclase [Vallitaleaceae bacterium]